MNKVYNNFNDITSEFKKFLQNLGLRKTQINVIPLILIGMIMSELQRESIQSHFPSMSHQI